jgi:hypothetical protein
MTFSGDGHRLLTLSHLWPKEEFASQIWDATPLPDRE